MLQHGSGIIGASGILLNFLRLVQKVLQIRKHGFPGVESKTGTLAGKVQADFRNPPRHHTIQIGRGETIQNTHVGFHQAKASPARAAALFRQNFIDPRCREYLHDPCFPQSLHLSALRGPHLQRIQRQAFFHGHFREVQSHTQPSLLQKLALLQGHGLENGG